MEGAKGFKDRLQLEEEYKTLWKALKPDEKKFVEAYISTMNLRHSAQAAGEKYQNGEGFMRKSAVREYLDWHMRNFAMTDVEVLALTSQIARADLADYFRVVRRYRPTRIHIPVSEHVRNLATEIEESEEFLAEAIRSELLDNLEIEVYKQDLKSKKAKLISFQIKLRNCPHATIEVDGPPEVVEEAEPDSIQIVKNRQAGRIKSFKQTRYGVEIEMYPADAALDRLAKMYGMYKQDNEQQVPPPSAINVTVVPPVPDEDDE